MVKRKTKFMCQECGYESPKWLGKCPGCGEWNKMVIECEGSSVKVWVNDTLVNHGTECTADKGQIAVQAESSEVEFRKIELTKLKK